MKKIFETKEEARDRFEELRNSMPSFRYGAGCDAFRREIWKDGDYFTAYFARCENEIRVFVKDCSISSTATLDKIREFFDEVTKWGVTFKGCRTLGEWKAYCEGVKEGFDRAKYRIAEYDPTCYDDETKLFNEEVDKEFAEWAEVFDEEPESVACPEITAERTRSCAETKTEQGGKMRKIETFRLKQYGLARDLFPGVTRLDDEINRWAEENGAVILDIKPAVLKDYVLYTVIYETGAPESDGQEG